jgi:hypothetical protein
MPPKPLVTTQPTSGSNEEGSGGMFQSKRRIPRPLAVLRESFLIFAFWDMSVQTALIVFVAIPVGAVLLWRLGLLLVNRTFDVA